MTPDEDARHQRHHEWYHEMEGSPCLPGCIYIKQPEQAEPKPEQVVAKDDSDGSDNWLTDVLLILGGMGLAFLFIGVSAGR